MNSIFTLSKYSRYSFCQKSVAVRIFCLKPSLTVAWAVPFIESPDACGRDRVEEEDSCQGLMCHGQYHVTV